MKKYLFILGLLLFAFILANLDIQAIAGILAQTNPSLLLAVVVLLFLLILLKGLKWKQIIKAHQADIGLADASVLFLIGIFLGSVTPGRLGDLVKAFYLKQKQFPFFLALSTVILDRVIDIGVLISLGGTSLLALTYFFGLEVISFQLILLLFGVMLVGLLFLLRKNLVKKIFRPVYRLFVPKKLKPSLSFSFNAFYAALGKVKKNKLRLFFSLCLGLVIWLITAFSAYILLLALGITVVPFYFMFLVLPIIALIELIPVSFSGIGTRDAALIILFSIYGVTAEQAVAYSLLFLFINYLIISFVGWILFTLNPLKIPFGEIKSHFSAENP